MKLKSAVFLIHSFCIYSCCVAQSAGPTTLNAGGGSAITGGNTYEWSIAEMTMVTTLISGNLVVTQGILQPGQAPAGIEEYEQHFFDSFLVYPIPTEDILYLKPGFENGGKLAWALYDVQGRQLGFRSVQLIQGNEIQHIDLSTLPAANYFLRVQFESGQGTISAAYTVQKVL